MFSFNSRLSLFFRQSVQRYNHNKYWRRRNYVINSTNRNFLLKILYLFLIKRSDAFHCASMGTNFNSGADFLTPPHLPHGLNGIIIGHDVKVGKDCTIFQQVTIAHGSVVIGDNVIIGAGAKILPNVRVGNSVKIGANCVVVEDIPDNSTVVKPKPRIIQR